MKIYKGLLAVLLSIISFGTGFSQNTKEDKKQEKATEIQSLVQSKNYVFTVQSVQPASGRIINTTSMYDLKVLGDSLISELPYFGRAYTAPIDPSDGGFNFTSTDFSYTADEHKKGIWEIVITPQTRQHDVRQMYLTIADNGNATLRIVSNNRQTISYNGYITGRNNS